MAINESLKSSTGDAQITDVDVVSSALPAGAATAANQAIAITALQLIDNLVTALQTVGTDELRVDLTTMGGSALSPNHLKTINWPHQRVHDAESWTTHFQNVVTNIGEMTVIAFNAPASNEIHMVFTVESTHDATAYLYRDTSIDPDEGTEVTPTNRNQSGTPANCTATSIQAAPAAGEMTTYNEAQAVDANITTTTELDTLHLLGGEGPKALGAEKGGREVEEWIFTGSTQAAIMMVTGTNDDATHIIRVDFYEE